MKKIIMIIAGLVLLQLVFVSATFAQDPSAQGGGGYYNPGYRQPYRQPYYGGDNYNYGYNYNRGYNYHYPGSRYYYSNCCYPRYQSNYNCRPSYGYQNYGNYGYGYNPGYGNYNYGYNPGYGNSY